MKNKLLTVLNQCIYNKSIEDFNLIIELISTINDDKTSDIKLSQNNIGIYVSMFYDGKLFSVMFTDNNMLLFSLPSDISRTYVIDNCSYNISYSDLRNILNSDN